MFKAFFIAAVLPVLSVLADPTPDAPAPGQVFNEGANCNIAWAADDSGKWTTMNIQLMTGDNFNMVHLTTVATVDGTDATKTTFDYPCPSVEPNSAIYFYQFSSPASPNLTWTGRFAIADASGATTPPSESTQPGSGGAIPWGKGALSDPSSAKPPPAYLGASGATSGSGVSTVVIPTTAAAPLTTTTNAPSGSSGSSTFTTVRSTGTSAGSQSSSSSSSSSTAAPATTSASGAAVFADFKARGVQALVGLACTAFVFVSLF